MSNFERIPVSGPWITEKEIDYVKDAVANAWYHNANYYQNKFEENFAAYIGSTYAIALPSCTSAIHLALLSLGIGPGDEVIVPDITWIASAAPIDYVGATPIFADIDEKSWCLSIEHLEKQITKKTKAIIVVDLYGNMPDWDSLNQLANKYGITIIEDAAEALGSVYKGKKAGSLGDIGVFSFHGSKTITTGEGGMLVTNNEDIYRRCMFLRDHGRNPGDVMFWNTEIGYKYKMSSMQAALGVAQLERIDEILFKKRQVFSWYSEFLDSNQYVTLNQKDLNVNNSYWMVTVVLDGSLDINKEDIISNLDKYSIDCRPFFYPLSMLPAFDKYKTSNEARIFNRNSYTISPRGVNLPSALNLTRSQVQYVCEKLNLECTNKIEI